MMFGLSRMSASFALGSDWLGETLLTLASLRAGLTRSSRLEDLPDHLRPDVGLPPREKVADPRNPRW
jgi:hypothetical protein